MYTVVGPILVTLGILFFLTWSFSLRRVLAREVLTRHPIFNK